MGVTMVEQKVIELIEDEGLPCKTVGGGAPCKQSRAYQIGADDNAEDANDGVRTIDTLPGKQ